MRARRWTTGQQSSVFSHHP